MRSSLQIQAEFNRSEQITAAVSACQKIVMMGKIPAEFIPICPLYNVSPERWRAMIVHVWDNRDLYI